MVAQLWNGKSCLLSINNHQICWKVFKSPEPVVFFQTMNGTGRTESGFSLLYIVLPADTESYFAVGHWSLRITNWEVHPVAHVGIHGERPKSPAKYGAQISICSHVVICVGISSAVHFDLIWDDHSISCHKSTFEPRRNTLSRIIICQVKNHRISIKMG